MLHLVAFVQIDFSLMICLWAVKRKGGTVRSGAVGIWRQQVSRDGINVTSAFTKFSFLCAYFFHYWHCAFQLTCVEMFCSVTRHWTPEVFSSPEIIHIKKPSRNQSIVDVSLFDFVGVIRYGSEDIIAPPSHWAALRSCTQKMSLSLVNIQKISFERRL